MTSSCHSLKPGDILDGRFHIVRLLGRGNFSEVYLAKQFVCGLAFRQVALKVFSKQVTPGNAPEVLQDLIMLSGLAREEPSLAVDRHLVHILDGVTARDHGEPTCLTMEFVPGGTLHKAIERYGGLPGVRGILVEHSLHYLRQILVPLAWMHSLDPVGVHGDLHPGNVLVTGRGELKLADFGLAAHLPAPVFGGAIDYQAPETLLGQPGDSRMDVYGVGLMWYEMLTGHLPFRDETPRSLGDQLRILSLEIESLGIEPSQEKDRKSAERNAVQAKYVAAQIQARKQPIPPASEENEQLRDYLGLEDILNRCLRFLPQERFFDAAALQKELDAYLAGRPKEEWLPAGDPSPSKEPQGPESDRGPDVLPPPTVDMLLDQARRLADRDQFEAALDMADRAAALDSCSPRVGAHKARIAVRAAAKAAGDSRTAWLDRAFKYVTRVRAQAPHDPDVKEALAEVYEAAGQPEVAANFRKQAADLRSKARRRVP